MQEHTIGICILFFNKLDQTIECIKSFLPSGLPIYVLNNGSETVFREELAKYVSRHINIKLIDSEKNLGISIGRNRLIEESKEEWLLFVDNDITIKPKDWDNRLSKHIVQNPDVEVFIPRLNNLHEKRYSRETYCKISDEGTVEFLTSEDGKTNMFPGGACIINRSVFKRIGMYEPEIFVGFEDFELAIRGIKSGQPIKGQFVKDIELIHNHIFVKTDADKKSVQTRYNIDLIQASHDFILKKHHVNIEGDFKPWVQEQIDQLTVEKGSSLLSRIIKKLR